MLRLFSEHSLKRVHMLTCWEPDENLLSLIESKGFWEDRKTALFFWDGKAPLWHQRKISYRTLRHLSLKFASALSHTRGVHSKERVAIMLPNSPQFAIAYFGILAIGAIAVPINPLYTAHEILTILKDSGATTIILWDTFYPLISKIEKDISASSWIKNIIVTGTEDALPGLKRFFYKMQARKKNELFDFTNCNSNIASFGTLIKEAPTTKENLRCAISSDDVALLLYTSGTIADPKGVMHTHASLRANAQSCASAYPELVHVASKKIPVFLAAAPYFHIMGLTTMLHLPLLLRAQVILLPRPTGATMISAICYTKSSVFIGVPKMYKALLDIFLKKETPYDLSSLDICISGAVEIPEELKNNFEQIVGKEIYVGYGMSETGITHCQRRDMGKRGSVGIPFSGVLQKILNQDRCGIGEILIKGRGVMRGYWTSGTGIDGEKTSKCIDSEHWFHTGDLGRIDPDGVLFFVGRIKDMIKGLGGENIYPGEIERVLLAHPLVAEAAVAGIKDKKWGEKIKAFLVLKDQGLEKHFSQKDIFDHCRKRLAPFKIPHEIECRSELPKNFAGKILKKELTK